MGTPPPSLLEVHESASGDVSPTSAFVHVVLNGDRFFSGRAAFEKAEELKRLVAALAARGVPESSLALEGVSVDVSSGVFSKSSSVTYRVRIVLKNLELLTGVLDAVAEAKKASLTNVDWNYDDSAAEEHALLRQAGQRATEKARVLAESVGATLGKLHTVREERIDPTGHHQSVPIGAAMPMRARMGSVQQELGGLELAPKKHVTVRVALAYELSS